MNGLVGASLDKVLSEIQSHPFRKVLFEGEGTGGMASYVAGWMASKGMDVIVLDGANRFDPYAVSFFARRIGGSPEKLLKSIRISRAFTCYQMATLMGERLVSLLEQEGAMAQRPKPRVILLGPITTFMDEDVPEREAKPLFERSLRKIEALAEGGTPFFLFQSFVSPHSKRAYLVRRLFWFADLVCKIHLDEEGPKVTLEKTPVDFKSQIPDAKCQMNSIHPFQITRG